MKSSDEYEIVFSGDDKGLSGAVDNVRRKMESLAESDNKVKRHLTGFIQDASRATSATQLLASGVYRLSEAFKVGIAGGVLAGVMMQVYESGKKTTDTMDALATSMQDLQKTSNASDFSKPVERLKAEAEAAEKAAKESRAEAKAIGGDEINKHLFLGAAGAVAEGASTLFGGSFKNPYRGVAAQHNDNADEADRIAGQRRTEIIRREKMSEEDMDLRISEATGPASLQKSLNVRIERLKLAKEELHLAQNASVIDKADIQQKTLSLRQSEQSLKALNAEVGLADSLYKIEERKMNVRTSAEGTTEKTYRLAKLSAEAAAEEAKAMEAKNVEQGKFLRLKAQEAAKVPGQIDEQLNKGKSNKEVRDRIRDQQKEERDAEKFRARREKDEGLIPTKRDMQGRVEEGIDPVTGEKVKKERKWDDIFNREKKDAEKDGAGAGAAVDKKRKDAAVEKDAAKDGKKGEGKLEGLVEKTNAKLEEVKKEITSLVAKR